MAALVTPGAPPPSLGPGTAQGKATTPQSQQLLPAHSTTGQTEPGNDSTAPCQPCPRELQHVGTEQPRSRRRIHGLLHISSCPKDSAGRLCDHKHGGDTVRTEEAAVEAPYQKPGARPRRPILLGKQHGTGSRAVTEGAPLHRQEVSQTKHK